MNQLLNTIVKNGKLPPVEFNVKVENNSIIKIAAAAVITAAIIIFISALLKNK
jgi:hypothetical protein